MLTPLSNSTVFLPPAAAPGDILFNSTGKNLVATEVGPGTGPSFIDTFSVGADGRRAAAPGSPFPSQALGPFGSEFRPTNPAELYVSNAHGGANVGSVSAFHVAGTGVLDSSYRILGDGSLSLLGSTVFNDPTGLRPFDARLDPSGKTLYVVDAGLDRVSAFAVDDAELDASPFALPAGATPFGIVVMRSDFDRR